MLHIGHIISDFQIIMAQQTYHGERPDGVVILGSRKLGDDTSFVVATVEQRNVDAPEPADHWRQGYYFEGSNITHRYNMALEFFLRETGALDLMREHLSTKL